jgi:hypothetical protein
VAAALALVEVSSWIVPGSFIPPSLDTRCTSPPTVSTGRVGAAALTVDIGVSCSSVEMRIQTAIPNTTASTAKNSGRNQRFNSRLPGRPG